MPETRSAAFEKLGPVMQALTPDRAMRDADAYLAFLGTDERVHEGPVGTVGYCMGGALALRTAAHAPDRVAAVASFHGGRLATDRPDSVHLLAGRITAEVYIGHADNDGSMPPEQQERLGKALSEAGVRHRTELYAGATHGFTMADTAAYDEAATERHWDRLTDLFARTLLLAALTRGADSGADSFRRLATGSVICCGLTGPPSPRSLPRGSPGG